MSNGSAGLGTVSAMVHGNPTDIDVSQWWTSGDSGVHIETPDTCIAMQDDQAPPWHACSLRAPWATTARTRQ